MVLIQLYLWNNSMCLYVIFYMYSFRKNLEEWILTVVSVEEVFFFSFILA